MKARTLRIGSMIGAATVAAAIAIAPSTAGARPAGEAPDLTDLGTFPVGSTIHAPYDCSDLAEIAAGAWGRIDDEGPLGDTDLPVGGSMYSFTPNVAPGDYVAIVLCGEEIDEPSQEEIVARFLEGIFDVGDTTDEYFYSFTLVSCDTPPDTSPDTTPDTTDAGTTTSTSAATTTSTTMATTTSTTDVPPGPARAPHGVDCPDLGSGGGTLPETGSSSTGTVAIVAILALLAGGALLVTRRRVTT